MRFGSESDYFRARPSGCEPLAVLVCEDDVLAAESAKRLFACGFDDLVAVGAGAPALADRPGCSSFPAETHNPAALARLLNRLISANAGRWMLIAFNGEFLFHPFAETRTAPDLIEFLSSERRASAMAYAIDLYTDAMVAGGRPNLDEAWFDSEGWYGFERGEGVVDVYGGLGWRFEDQTPDTLARINRPALFFARPGLTLRPDLWFDDPEMNTVSCPWHHNPTMALMSFRRTRRILAHPELQDLKTLIWPKSVRFDWNSDKLVSQGLIEPGQWM